MSFGILLFAWLLCFSYKQKASIDHSLSLSQRLTQINIIIEYVFKQNFPEASSAVYIWFLVYCIIIIIIQW